MRFLRAAEHNNISESCPFGGDGHLDRHLLSLSAVMSMSVSVFGFLRGMMAAEFIDCQGREGALKFLCFDRDQQSPSISSTSSQGGACRERLKWRMVYTYLKLQLVATVGVCLNLQL